MEVFGYACKKQCTFPLGWLIRTANMLLGVDTSSTGDHGFQTSLISFFFRSSGLSDDSCTLMQ